MEHVADGLIRNMRVEEMIVGEDGRTYITYSFGSLRPLDSLQLSIMKANDTTWDEFKDSLKKVIADIEKHEERVCVYDTMEVFSETNIGKFLSELEEDIDDTHCLFCKEELIDDGHCPNECGDQIIE